MHFLRVIRGSLVVLVWVGLALPACTIESPELPTYEAELRIPIGSVERSIEELLEGQDDFVIGEDGSLSITQSGELAEVEIGAELNADLDGLALQAQIGNIELDATDPVGFDYRLGDLYPPAAPFDGMQAPVPPFSFEVDAPEQDLPGFRSATVASGGLIIEVTNGLPVPVGGAAPADQIRIELIDPSDAHVVAALAIPDAIAPNATSTHQLDFAGQVLPDAVQVHLEGSSPGSGGAFVDIDIDAQLAVSVRTTALVVSEAEAEIGAQSFEETTVVDLPEDIQVRYATLSAGTLDLDLRNDLSVPVDVDIRIVPFLDDLGQPLVIAVALPPGAATVENVDLTLYHIDFGGGVGDQLDVIASVSTPGSSGNAVTIRATDEVVVDVAPLSLAFDSVTGIVEPIEVDLESSTTTLDLPEELDELQLQGATLDISFVSTVGLPSVIDLQLMGTNEDGTQVPLDVQIDMPAQLVDGPPYNVRLDQDNSGILPFLNNLPSEIEIQGSAVVGDGVTVGTVRSDDRVSARWSIAAPMTVALMQQTVDIEASEVDLEEDMRDELRSRLIELTLDAEVTSTLPVGALAYIGLDTDETRVHRKPELLVGPIEIPAAGPARGDGSRAPVLAHTSVILDSAGVETITEDFLFHGLRIELPGTNGEFVTLHADDRVEITGFLRARVLVGEVD